MGDFRASIKITFEMFGKKKECDMWINYFPDSECEGVDQRVIDFFRENWEIFKSRYDEIIWKSEKKERDAKEKEFELLELKRLKSKYEVKDKNNS